MSLPRFAVTFCVMDQEAGSNPFWHACLLLSQYDEQTKKWEVVDHLGYYPQRATDQPSLTNKIKRYLRMNIQLYGNHAMIRKEKIHEIDLGYGMHGITYELSEKKFNNLKDQFKKLKDDQAAAIKEHVETLNLQPEEKFHEYEYEKHSHEIYALELDKARREGVEPRLDNFTFGVYTCKSKMLKVLEGTLRPDQITHIAGWNTAIPRLGCEMEKIALHSRGPSHKYTKTSGEVVQTRLNDEKGVKLYWSSPPTFEETPRHAPTFFNIGSGMKADVSQMIKKLQKLEKLFTNAVLDDGLNSRRKKLLRLIQQHYSVFSRIGAEKFADADEKIQKLKDHLHNANILINKLSMAITNNFSFEHNHADQTVLAAYLNPHSRDEFFAITGQDQPSLFVRRADVRQPAM